MKMMYHCKDEASSSIWLYETFQSLMKSTRTNQEFCAQTLVLM